MVSTSLLEIFDRRVAVYETQLARCRESLDEDAVHDLRVAIRRLLALLALLRSPGFELRGKKLGRALKSQLASLSVLRDTQVMLARVTALLPQWSAGEAMLLDLQQRERVLLEQARVALAAVDAGRLQRRLHTLRCRLVEWSGDVGAAMDAALLQARDALLARRVPLSAATVDRALLDRLHRERIAWKHFRYTAEILWEIDSASCDKAWLDALRAQQTLLGSVQDARVFIAALQVARV